ncbi:MAG: NERD domain-containing protein [Longimicrobiaceae bacterium]
MCDILVVCGSDVIIISVKDILLTQTNNPSVDWSRWRRRAIEQSAKQIYGAERALERLHRVVQEDGSEGLPLPPPAQRRIHRIAIAFGGSGEVPLTYGDFGRGFVHVLDEQAFDILLAELDTISDFLRYLSTKETYFRRGARALFEGNEEDLLAFYLQRGRRFPKRVDLLVLGDDLWSGFSRRSDYLQKKAHDRVSYLWDRLIELHIHGIAAGYAYVSPGLLPAEPALREMALEDRYWRRVLSKSLIDFLHLAQEKKVRARMALSPERKTTYVFLPAYPDEDPRERMAELTARCWVARDRVRDHATVVGLAVGEPKQGQPLDLLYLYLPEWTDEDHARAVEAREELGFFRNPVEFRTNEEEYPSSE